MISRTASIFLLLNLAWASFAATSDSSQDQAQVKQAAVQLLAFTKVVVQSLDGHEISDQAVPLSITFQGHEISLLIKVTSLAKGESIQATSVEAPIPSPYSEFHCVLAGDGQGTAMQIMAITASLSDGATISAYRSGHDLDLTYQSQLVRGHVVINQADQPALVQTTTLAPSDTEHSHPVALLSWQDGLSLSVFVTARDTAPSQTAVSPENP